MAAKGKWYWGCTQPAALTLSSLPLPAGRWPKGFLGTMTLVLLTLLRKLLFTCSVVSNSLKPHGLQHTRLPCPSSSPWECSNSCPLSRWCHPTILFSVVSFSSCPQSFPASVSFPKSWLFSSGGKVLELQLQRQSFQWTVRVDFLWDWLVWSPCFPSNSQESSPTPQFESTNSLALSLLYGPTLTSIHDYWKKKVLIIWTFVVK